MLNINYKDKFKGENKFCDGYLEYISPKNQIIIFLIILFIFNIYFGGIIKVHSFFMDDLNTWELFKDKNFIEFIFNTEAYKFRPFSNLFLLIGLEIIGDEIYFSEYIILIINYLVLCSLFYMFFKISKNIVLSFISSILFIISRFSYYSTGQYLGIMENIGLLIAIILLYKLINLNNNDHSLKNIILLNLISIIGVFSHERYLSLFFLIVFYFIILYLLNIKGDKESKKYIFKNIFFTFFVFIFLVFFRSIILGKGSFSGTGGTNVVESLNIKQILIFFLKGILNILGVGAGEEYLYGISFSNTNITIKVIIIFSSLLTLYLILRSFIYIIKNRISFLNYVTIIFFILITLLSSCVTIRLEMRWLFTPYVGLLVLFLYLFNNNTKYNINLFFIKKNIIIVLVICTIVSNLYYMSHWNKIYFYGGQMFYNKIYEINERYHNDIYYNDRPIIFVEEKPIYIYKEEIEKFFRLNSPYNKEPENIYIFTNILDIPKELKNKNPILLISNIRNNYGDVWDRELIDLTNSINLLNIFN